MSKVGTFIYILSAIALVAIAFFVYLFFFAENKGNIGEPEKVMIIEMQKDGKTLYESYLSAPLVNAFAECEHIDSISAIEEPQDKTSKIYAENRHTADGYVCDALPFGLSALKLEMVYGSDCFDYNGRAGVIVPVSLAKELWDRENIIDKHICWDDPSRPMVRIVGVYKDYKDRPNVIYHTSSNKYNKDYTTCKFFTYIRAKSNANTIEKELNKALDKLLSEDEEAKKEYEGMNVVLRPLLFE